MAVGIQVWRPDGVMIVDTTTNIAAILGVNVSPGNGFTITDDWLLKGVPWYFFIPSGLYSFDNPGGGIPSVSFNGNQMTVTGSNIAGTIIYGVS